MAASKRARIQTSDAFLAVASDGEGGCFWEYLGAPMVLGTARDPLGSQANATFALNTDPRVPLLCAHGLGWFGPPGIELHGTNGHAIVVSGSATRFEETAVGIAIELYDSASGVAFEWSAQGVHGGGGIL